MKVVTKDQNQDGGETMQRVAKEYDFGNVTVGHSNRRSGVLPELQRKDR